MEDSAEIVRLRAEVARLNEALLSEGTTHRVMEQRLAQYFRDLERSNSELEQFAYAASHDLQEPLRMVQQYADMLEKVCKERHAEALLDEDVEVCLRHLGAGAGRARKLIDGLLAFSRVGRETTFEDASLGSIIDEAIETLNGAVSEAQATITKVGLMPVVKCDVSTMSRVLMNLFTNSIRFAKDGVSVEIEISVEDMDEEWLVRVSDNGIGIDPRYAERIFGIFQRLDPSKSGTGIGLAIAKKVVERHGGRIWVESMPGHGATFKFTLPKELG